MTAAIRLSRRMTRLPRAFIAQYFKHRKFMTIQLHSAPRASIYHTPPPNFAADFTDAIARPRYEHIDYRHHAAGRRRCRDFDISFH